MWHNGTHEDGDYDACNDQESSDRFDSWQSSVGKQDNEATGPDTDKIGNKYLPPLDLKTRMEESIHRHTLSTDDLSSAGQAQNPC